MSTIKSIEGEATLTTHYDEYLNVLEISICNKGGCKYVHVNPDEVDELIETLTESKNQIV